MKEKRSNGTALKIICAAIPIAALAVVLFLVLYPSAMARRERGKLVETLDALAALPDASVTITKMSSFDLGIAGEGSEARLEGGAAADFAEKTARSLDSAAYSGREDSPGGSWDTRLRFTSPDGAAVTLYLAPDGRIYFVRGATRFYFTPGQETELSLPSALR